jgi:hypothetical protein
MSCADVGVVGQAVEQRGRHLGVAEHARPFAERQVGRHDHRGLLREAADQVGTATDRRTGRTAETGQPFNQAASGEYVAGAYHQRFALAPGRFAMIDDGLGFQ